MKLKRGLSSVLSLVLIFPLIGCGKTVTLAQFAPYVRQSATAINNAVSDAWAAGIITSTQYENAREAIAKYGEFAPKTADFLASLQTLDSHNKAEVIGKLSEGIAIGKQIALASGLPPNSVAARVISAIVLGLDTTKSTIEAIKLSDNGIGVASVGEKTSIPASEIKATIPKTDKETAKYFEK